MCTILAFNKHIVDELKQKITDTNRTLITTIPSMGYKYVSKYAYARKCQLYLRDGKPNKQLTFINKNSLANRTRQLCKELYTEILDSKVVAEYKSRLSEKEINDLHTSIVAELADLCDSVRMHCSFDWDESIDKISITSAAIEERLILDSYANIQEYLVQNKNINNNLNLADMVREVLQRRIDEFLALDGIDYDGVHYVGIEYIDMVMFPVIFTQRLTIPSNVEPYTDYVLCDECQDMNKLQQKLLKRLNTGKTRYIFVGDNKQAIYAFAGADTQSVRNLTREYNLRQLPLNICYRCPENVVRVAKTIVPELEWNIDREDKGEVKFKTRTEAYEQLQPNDIILCRKNSEVMGNYSKLAFELKKDVCLVNYELVNKLTNEIKYCIGKYLKYYELGFNVQVELKQQMDEYVRSLDTPMSPRDYNDLQTQKISELVNKKIATRPKINITTPTLDYLCMCIQEYKDEGEYTLVADDNNLTAMYCDKILYLIQKYKDEKHLTGSAKIIDFEQYLTTFFKYKKDNNNAIIISSVHQMKGGEADNVYIFDYPSFPYKFKSATDEQLIQENNLQYVALTRAKKNLYLVLLDESANDKASGLNEQCKLDIKMCLDAK